MNRYATAAALLLFCSLPNVALTQTAPASPSTPLPEREGSAEFAFVGTTGNATTETIGLGGEFIYRPDQWESRVKVSYVRNKVEDVLRAQTFVLVARAQPHLQDRVSGYTQYGYQRDRFAGILDRNTLEGGLAFKWVQQPAHKLVVDTGLGYANEQRAFGPNLSTATIGGGGVYTLKIANGELSEDSHVVVSLPHGSDWRYTNAIALTAKVTAKFSLKVSNTIRYVNVPADGLKTTDAVTAVAFVAKF